MPTLTFRAELPCHPQELYEFHRSTEALHLLTPSFLNLEIEAGDLEVKAGARFVTRTRLLFFRQRWVAVIQHADANGFRDTAEESPFTYWSHWHRFLPRAGGSVLVDEIEYRTAFGWLSDAIAAIGLRLLFSHRHAVTRRALSGVHRAAGSERTVE